MNRRTMTTALKGQIGCRVTVCGFLETLRDQKSMQFLILRDHTGKAQCVHEKAKNPALAKAISGLTPESTVRIVGQVVAAPQVKLGGLEIVIEEVTIESIAMTPLPITRESNLDQRLDWRFLSLRDPKAFAIFQLQTLCEGALRTFWQENGFIEVHSPKLMGSASESGAELFSVKYFDRTAYLAQSPQFYKQMAMCAGFDRIFEIGPVFRANPSFTSRHDTEFTSVDVEVSWVESHDDVMRVEEQGLIYMLEQVSKQMGTRLRDLFETEVVVPTGPFPRIRLAEARQILKELGHTIPDEDDLDPQGERMLSEVILERFGSQFVFVTDYPINVRPFYHMRYDDDPGTTRSFDLLWNGLEITTGAQREHRYEILKNQAQEKGLGSSVDYYLEFFKYGVPPHGGFGLGLSRMLMILTGLKNVREVTFLYRGPHRLSP